MKQINIMNWTIEPEKWLHDYAETGYLVVENVVEPTLLEALRQALEAIEAGVANETLPPSLRSHVVLERDRTRHLHTGVVDSDAISLIMELPLFAPVFRDLILYPRVLDILETLFGSSEFAFHNYKAVYKMPGGAAPFQWHRDLPYLHHTSPNLLTCMLCLDPMTRENGATVMCPGTHRIPYAQVKESDADIPESEVPSPRVTIECPAGSAVLFHVNNIHGGGPNLSQTKRRNIIGIWVGPNCYPTTGNRYAYEFVMPRSQDEQRQRQSKLTFADKNSATV